MTDRRALELRVLAAGRLNSRASVLLHSRMAERIGLNASDTKALDLILERGAMTPSEIARSTGLTTASVTVLLDRLEGRGLIERTPDAADRRRVVIRPKATAMATVGAHLSPFIEELERRLARYSDAELTAIARFLDEIGQLALRHAGVDVPPAR